MDDLFGNNIITLEIPTNEILERLPKKEAEQIKDFMYFLNNFYATKDSKEFTSYIAKVFEMLKSNIVDYTCFTMACNFILWDSYKTDPQKAAIFNDIWMTFDSSVEKIFKAEDLQYYYRLTD